MRTTIVLLALLVALGVWASPPQQSRNVDETVTVTAKVPATIPVSAKNRSNPVAAKPESLARGKRLYGSQCAMCHGAVGKGDGKLTERLQLSVPGLEAFGKNRTDGELFYIIRNGHGTMPAEERLDDEWLWDLVNHVRTLAVTG